MPAKRTAPSKTRSLTPMQVNVAAQSAALFAKGVVRHVLPNGLTLLHRPDFSCPLVSMQVWVKTGSIHEGPLLGCGLSHYLEHLLFKTTAKRQQGAIAREVQETGGYINAYTTFDRTVYYIESPAESLAKAADILSDMVFGASLTPQDCEAERDVILREIAMGMDEPDQHLSQALFATAFRSHPYREPVIGHKDLFSGVTRDELWTYYKGRYAPNNMVVIVVGAAEFSAVLELVNSHFGQEPRRRIMEAAIPPEVDQLSKRSLTLEGKVQLTRGAMAFRIPSLRHADAPALDLAATLLGRGYSSRLWKRLRDGREIVHTIDAASWNPGDAGLFWVSYTCEPENREAAEEGVIATLKECVQEGFTDAEIEKARNQAIVGELNSRKTMSGQAGRLGAAEVVVGDLHYTQRYLERLANVQADELSRIIDTYLRPERLTCASLSPEGTGKKAAAAARHAHELPDFEQRTLSSGLRLLLQPDKRLPKVHFRLGALGGPLLESTGQRGISALLATLLTKDTQKRSAESLAETIESIGGTLSDFAGNNSFGIALEVLSQDSLKAVDLLAEMALQPAFLESTFYREKESHIASIRESLDEVVEYGRKSLRKHFFGNHAYAVDSDGLIDDLNTVTPELLKAHWQKLVRPDNLVVTVTGDFDPNALASQLEKAFAALKAPQTPSPSILAEILSSHLPAPVRCAVTERLPREQAVVFLAFPDAGIRDVDYAAGEALDEIFSDMAGNLFIKVREENSLAYFVGATRITGLTTGMFYLYAGTHPAAAKTVLELFNAEIERARSGGLTEAELARTRTRMKAAQISHQQVLGQRAMQATLDALYGLPENYWRKRPALYENLTLEDLRSFAQKYLRPEAAVALVVEPPMVNK